MKVKIKRIINLIVLAILAIITFVLVKNIPFILIGKNGNTSNNNIKVIQKTGEKNIVEAMAPGAVFELNEDNVKKEGDYWRVIGDGVPDPIYCAQKGASLNGHGKTYEDILAYAQSMNNKTTGWVKNKTHIKVDKLTSRAYYFDDGTREASDYEAYVLTWPEPDWNSWSGIKQEAIWDTKTLSSNKKVPKPSVGGIIADMLGIQAAAYSDFITNVKGNGGTMVKDDKTNQDEVKVNYNYNAKEYVVGPFKIDYVDGDYALVFGGIKDMYIVGKKTAKIEIKSFIIKGKEIEPKYFTPMEKHLVDINPQGYPKPNEEFYVKFDAVVDEQIDKIHIDFEWVEATATIKYFKAKKYKNVYTEKEEEKTENEKVGEKDVYDDAGNVTGKEDVMGDVPYYKCTIENSKVQEYDAGFQRLLTSSGKRELKKDSLEIPIPKPDEPPPPPTENLQIKLAGHVWEEESTGKETLPNGTKDGSENWKAGVEVILHYSDGSIVTKDANRNQLVNPYVTGDDGYYEFNDLDSKKKYYIEFVYDGQIYQATQYTSGTNPEAGQSNALENAGEREAFNNHFAEINSAPGSYVVRRGLYKSAGQTNTAYIISKTSSETPYGIKEIYDYVISEAVKAKSYSQAYSNALSRFGNNDSTKNKLQFIEDCRISSYTNTEGASGIYPIYDKFVEGTRGKTIGGIYYYPLYPKHLNIDFGLVKRETFDLALRKDVEKVTVEINGKVHTYTYDTRNAADETDDGTWDINIRLSDAYYNTKYSREIFASDYQYKASNYGDNSAAYGKTKDDELNVYVTYKLTVRNQSQSILGEVMEIVDYYDEDYEYVDERSYIQIKNGIRQTDSGYKDAISQGLAVAQTNQPVKATTSSKYGSGNETAIAGYDKLYIQGLQGKKLSSGQTAYIYLTFKVKKDNINNEDWIRLDEQVESAKAIGVGKENIAEINGFKTYYRNGTQIPNVGTVSGYGKAAGLFDVDSVPGNINPNDVPKDGKINYNNFEDDTDKAPNIRLILYRENGELVVRSIDGIVWEDERTEINNDQHTAVADGIKQNNEESINGVTVQLVELMDNGTEYIWKQFSSGQGSYDAIININNMIKNTVNDIRGGYVFKSYMPGNYVVRFIYGDTVKTVLPNTSTEVTNAFGQSGQNAKSYNGQDYKSTTYQEGITQNKEYVWREDSTWQNGIETLGKELTRVQTFKADCSNNETANATVPANAQQGYLYDITASDAKTNVSDAKDIMTDNNLNNPYSRLSADLNSREDVIGYSDVNVTNYIAEVLASHEKLPLNKEELRIKLEELMKETQMTAETGLINVELEYDRNATGDQVEGNPTSYKIQNVNLGLEERPKAQLAINKEVTNVKLTLADGSTLFDATDKATNVLWRDHKAYAFDYADYKLQADPMTKIREKNLYDVQYGLIQLSMDEELMHGATIKVSYKITVTNEGEVDYKENQFYYTGIVANKNTVVKTIANQAIDYVANNFQFYAVDNSSWQVISQEELLNGLVNMTLANETVKYNTVITTSASSNIANTLLVPKIYGSGVNSVSDDLILTQLITSENETDDLTYRNIVEIVKTSNDVGRRNAYSVVGNQNPIKEPAEVDSDRAEIIKILPPYGNAGMPYIIITTIILASAILIGGIIFIKKKVLR